MTSKSAAQVRDCRQKRLCVLPVRLALNGMRQSGACCPHCVQQVRMEWTGHAAHAACKASPFPP